MQTMAYTHFDTPQRVKIAKQTQISSKNSQKSNPKSSANLNKTSIVENRQKLLKIQRLKKGWNGYNAKALTKGVIKRAEKLLNTIIVQPKIFPTPNNSIQFEYYDRNDPAKYLEFDISYRQILCNDKPIAAKHINTRISEFYGIDS